MSLPEVVKFAVLLESPLASGQKWQNFVYEAKELIKMLNKFETKAEIHLTDNFDQFLEILTKVKVDCFVFDWNYKECNMLELMGKIKISKNFNTSAIIVLYDKKDEVNPSEYSALNINMAVTRPIFFENFNTDLKMYLEKKFSKLIPEHYNVLIIDDQPDILELVGLHLEQLDHKKIHKAGSVKDAKSLIGQTDYDLIIVDWNLGDGTCFDVVDHLRSFTERKRLLNALILVITGRDSIEDIMRLREYQISNHLIKPFDYFEFKEKLTDAFANKKSN